MDDAVRDYIDAIPPEHRPLFDRLHRLVLETHPEAAVVLSYQIPTYKVGRNRLFLGVWKHGVSIYGWRQGHDAGFSARHPELRTSKGTIQLRPETAAAIPDDQLRDLMRAALDVRDDLDQVVEQSRDVRDQARRVQDRVPPAQRRQNPPGQPGVERAVRARRHEVDTLEQAIAYQEQAADLQDRHGRPDRVAEARARADHDRGLLEQARAELAEDEAESDRQRDSGPPPLG